MSEDGTNIVSLSSVQKRRVEASASLREAPPDDILFQHTVFCQTCLPYRNPGNLEEWRQENGDILLFIEAGKLINPETRRKEKVYLPYGPKPRLILAHINSEAIKQGTPFMEIEDSMTAFVHRILSYGNFSARNPSGRDIKIYKEQLNRLSAADVTIGLVENGHVLQFDTKIISKKDLWFSKDPNQRILWPSKIELSQDYFSCLQKHAVPLSEKALAALAPSCLALDIYCWLAQRLHRIPLARPQFISWAALKNQFGRGYKGSRQFKYEFLKTLRLVKAHYSAANFQDHLSGLQLRNSPPPVPKIQAQVLDLKRS